MRERAKDDGGAAQATNHPELLAGLGMVTNAASASSPGDPATARAHGGGRGGHDDHGGHGSHEDVVLGLLSAMETLDPKQVGSWLDDDVIYQNSGLPDVVGRTTVEQFLASFLGAFASLTTQVVNIVSRGPLVFTERLEHHVLSHDSPIGHPGAEIMLRVAGWHEVRNGVVVRWSDYWDTRQYVATMGIDLPAPRAATEDLDRANGRR